MSNQNKLKESYDVNIIVSGPGQTIHNELKIIEDILRAHGYSVHMDNPYPENEPLNVGNGKGRKILITAKHLPWGG